MSERVDPASSSGDREFYSLSLQVSETLLKQTSSARVLENGLQEIAGLLHADMALLHLRSAEGSGLAAAYGLEGVPAVHRLQQPEPEELDVLALGRWLEWKLPEDYRGPAENNYHLLGAEHAISVGLRAGPELVGYAAFLFRVWADRNAMMSALGTLGAIWGLQYERLLESERRGRAEEQLRLYATALDNLNELVIVAEADPKNPSDSRITYVNQCIKEKTGYDPEDLLGQTPRILQGPGTDRAEVNRMKVKLRRFEPVSGELLNYRKDGTPYWVFISVHPFSSTGGRPTHFVSVQTDITERRQAEEVLREREARLRTIVESKPECVKIVATDGTLLEMNPAGLRMIEADDGAQVIGKPASELIHPDDRPAFAELHERACRGEVGELEFCIIGLKGTVRWLETHSAPLRDAKGVITSVLSVTRDITEQRAAAALADEYRQRLETEIGRLQALRQIDRSITGSADIRLTAATLLEQMSRQLGVRRGELFRVLPGTLLLESVAYIGLSIDLGDGERVAEVAVQAMRRREVLEVPLPHSPNNGSGHANGPAVLVLVPLIAKGLVKGVLAAQYPYPGEVEAGWMEFLHVLGAQAAIALESSELFEELQRSNAEVFYAYDQTIEGWARALDLRDRKTEGHSRRVTDLTVQLALAMGYRSGDLVHIRRGALLHDIGKMGVPDYILQKPGPLTPEEWEVMKNHTTLGYQLLRPIEFLRPALDIPYCHHERWDGSGYPRGLKGEEIPIAARMFAVVDVFDALSSDRPYRKAWPREQVLEHIRHSASTHFDPAVVEAFTKMLGKAN